MLTAPARAAIHNFISLLRCWWSRAPRQNMGTDLLLWHSSRELTLFICRAALKHLANTFSITAALAESLGHLIYQATCFWLTAGRLDEFLDLKRVCFQDIFSPKHASPQLTKFTLQHTDFPFVTISALPRQPLFLLNLSGLCAKSTCR